MIWIKDESNAGFYDWMVAILENNPPCVDWLCLIDDNNPAARAAQTTES